MELDQLSWTTLFKTNGWAQSNPFPVRPFLAMLLLEIIFTLDFQIVNMNPGTDHTLHLAPVDNLLHPLIPLKTPGPQMLAHVQSLSQVEMSSLNCHHSMKILMLSFQPHVKGMQVLVCTVYRNVSSFIRHRTVQILKNIPILAEAFLLLS